MLDALLVGASCFARRRGRQKPKKDKGNEDNVSGLR